jgi:hypothetical protein
MSDVTHGGDATSTGREGLQQVRLAKSLPNETGRFECLRIRAARSFVTITYLYMSITNRRSAERLSAFDSFDVSDAVLKRSRIPDCDSGLRLEIRSG